MRVISKAAKTGRLRKCSPTGPFEVLFVTIAEHNVSIRSDISVTQTIQGNMFAFLVNRMLRLEDNDKPGRNVITYVVLFSVTSLSFESSDKPAKQSLRICLIEGGTVRPFTK